MKLLKYIWRNVTRNKIRSSLTILSMAFSLALMTILYGYLAMQGVTEREADKYDRVVALNKLGFASPLPIAHVEKVRKMEAVAAATPYAWFGGTYKDGSVFFAQFAVEPKYFFDIYSEYKIPLEQVEAFKSNRRGCVADKALAEQLKWKIGDRIPLKGEIYTVDLDLQLVGIYEAPLNTGSLVFDWNYLDDEINKSELGFPVGAGSIVAKCKSTNEVEIVCEDIDAMFANSENSTQTRTEAAFSRMFADMLGDVQKYIEYISFAVVFALALVAATGMAMSMRERTTEVAILKAIGFSKGRVLSLVLGESMMIALIGGLIGIAGGMGMLALMSSVPAAALFFPVPITALFGPWLLGLVAVAAGIGLASGLVPAVLAAQLSVVDGLRKVV